MNSLYSGLTAWLLLTLAGVGGLCALVAVLWVRHATLAQVDYEMQQVARMIASRPFTAIDTRPLRPLLPAGDVRHDRDDDLVVTVRDGQGRLLYATPTNRFLRGGLLPPLAGLGFQTVQIDRDSYRVLVARAGDERIQVAQSSDEILEQERHIAVATLLPIGLLLPILAIVLGLVIRSQLRPLRVAAAVLAGRPPLSLEVLPAHGIPAEVRPLVDEINRLLGRLSTAMEREQRFVTDAAHALRSPLTALQLQAEVLEGDHSPEERSARLVELRAGIHRIIRVSEQLLNLARSQQETGPVTVASDLQATLAEAAALYAAAAKARDIRLQLNTVSPAHVPGSTRQLTLIWSNLLDNAIRFTPPGGQVTVQVSHPDGGARIDIHDEGCGLPPQELERVFERFYQTGRAHSGSGLGLATVQALVRRLKGRVTLANRIDAPGLVASVWLPRAPGDPVSSGGFPDGHPASSACAERDAGQAC